MTKNKNDDITFTGNIRFLNIPLFKDNSTITLNKYYKILVGPDGTVLKIEDTISDLVALKTDLVPDVFVTDSILYNLVPTKKVVLLTLIGINPDIILPPAEDNLGLIIIITHAGSGDGNVLSTIPLEDIWDGGILVSTKIISQGAILRFTSDGIAYRTQ